ncbi:hypothetical protein OK016_22960 [Vibrio chagasii]|nr:hypothetical protein [Vibrio chagasii]
MAGARNGEETLITNNWKELGINRIARCHRRHTLNLGPWPELKQPTKKLKEQQISESKMVHRSLFSGVNHLIESCSR